MIIAFEMQNTVDKYVGKVMDKILLLLFGFTGKCFIGNGNITQIPVIAIGKG